MTAPLLISATWVLPVASDPIREGAVLVEDGSIVAAGARSELDPQTPARVERRHFEGATVMPGLVNAHTHLALTDLADVVPSMPFVEWLPALVAAVRDWQIPDFEASAEHGARLLLDSGVTTVADVAYGPAEIAMAARVGLAGVFYTEILGVPARELDAELRRSRFSPNALGDRTERIRLGLSPHSPYTSGPGLLRAVHERAVSLGIPTMVHLAESAAETELVSRGTGPLAATTSRTADGFSPTATGPTSYLAELGVLGGTTVVHLGEATLEDIALLAKSGVRGAVACPRSNRYLGNRVADVPALLKRGIEVGIGTDSAASNLDLDLMSDVRALSVEHPSLNARTLVEIATMRGAQAIGMQDRCGALAPGLAADIAVFQVAENDPEQGVVEQAGAETLVALMAGGSWRIG